MRPRGFSLIEMLIVLILISLSIALVAPSLARFSKGIVLKAAAKKISAILRYYRSEAVQKGKVWQVLFDANLGEVRVQPIDSKESTSGNEKKETQEKKMVFPKYPLPEGVSLKEIKVSETEYPSDLPTIEFYPNGGSNGGSILLGAQDQKGYRIKIHFLTGVVEVEAG